MHDQIASDYTVARLTRERLKHLESLHEAVYHKKPSRDFFTIKYNTNYTGAEYVGYIAYNIAGEPIAYYGIVPCFLMLANQKILAAQSVDTMTHHAFRKKGMFVALANMTFKLCESLGISVIFGFPNHHSLHGFLEKLNWKKIDAMSAFMISVSTVPLAKWCQKLNITKRFYGYYANLLLKKSTLPINIIPNSVIADQYGGVFRDGDYESSKAYYERKVLKLDGALLWCRLTSELLIGDILVEPEAFPKFLKDIRRLAIRLGVSRIQFHSSIGTTLYSLFALHCPSQPSYPVIFLDLSSGIELHKFKFSLADIDIF